MRKFLTIFLRLVFGAIAIGWSVIAQAAPQFWDPNTSAGIQHGDGYWSTADADWSSVSNGSNPNNVWTNGNSAQFGKAHADGTSVVSVTGTVTAAQVIITNGTYTVVITNGGQVLSGGTPGQSVIGWYGSNNTMLVVGGAGVTSRWEVGGSGASTQNLSIGLGTALATNNLLQIDGSGVTGGANVTNVANCTLGSGAAYNRMIINNGGLMTLGGTATVGGTSNTVAVIGGTGVTSVWDNGQGTMTIAGTVGSQFVVDGGGVTGSALATNVQDLNIGSASDVGVSMIVSNKGVLAVSGSIKIGRGTASETDAALVIAMGGIVRTTTNTSVGYKSSNNFDAWRLGLIVRDAESVFDGNGTRLVISELGGGGLGLCHYNNRMILDGGLITNVCFHVGVDNGGSTYYRQNENGGLMLVTNGGRMYCGAGSDDTRFHQTGGSYGGYYVINGTDIVTGVNTLWDNGGKGLVYATSVNRYDCPAATNTFVLDDGALMTNVGYLNFAWRSAFNNRFVVTNGARLYSTNGMIGLSGISTGNQFIVTGSRSVTNSLWDLGGGALRIGNNAGSNNVLIIDKGGVVTNVGGLSATANSNHVELLGGVLSATGVTANCGWLFAIGDGSQTARLSVLPGGALFADGLFVQSNGVFNAAGMINAAVAGLVISNGASINPGGAGGGVMTVGGSGLTWLGGATYLCEITNFSGGAGVGWDLINVSTQLLFTNNAPNWVIRLDTLGAPAANFISNADYNLKIATAGDGIQGWDASRNTLYTNSIVNIFQGTWGVTNIGTNIYATYRAAALDATVVREWDAPSNGNWTVGMNWKDRFPPAAGNPAMRLLFGGGAGDPAYYATNDNASFILNRLTFSNANTAVTNALAGNPLEFWYDDATIEHKGAGGAVISNIVTLATNLTLTGDGAGLLTLANAIGGAGNLVKQGSGTAILRGTNAFDGSFQVAGAGGTLRIERFTALGTTNPVTVFAGTLDQDTGTDYTNAARNLTVTGNGSVWTNNRAVVTSTNGTVLITDNALMACPSGIRVSDNGTQPFSFTASNGATIRHGGMALYGVGSSAKIAGGVSGQTLFSGGVSFYSSISTVSNLVVFDGCGVEEGVILTNGTLSIARGILNTIILTNKASVYAASAYSIGDPNGAAQSISNKLVIAGGSRLKHLASPTHALGPRGGFGNELVITDPGSVLDLNGGVFSIAYNNVAGIVASNNILRVINGGTITNGEVNFNWFSTADAYNALIVSNGGRAFLTQPIPLSRTAGTVGDMVLVADTGSVLNTAGQQIQVGYGSSCTGNLLQIENGGMVTNSAIAVGLGIVAHLNSAVITNGGRMFSGAASYIGSGLFASDSRASVIGADSLWNAGGNLISIGSGHNASNSVLWIADGGLVTNAVLTIGSGASNCINNCAVVTNGGRLVTTGSARIGVGGAGTNNYAVVSGDGSSWNLNNGFLMVGINNAVTNNYLLIDQNGTVDGIGSLTNNPGNYIYLNWGTLGCAVAAFTNGLIFPVGDCVHTATLKSIAPAGTVAFGSGLHVQTNGILMGIGTVNGAAAGVIVTNGGTVNPGVGGAGVLAIGGSNLTWQGGGIYRCEITNMSSGPGVGWDLLSVNTQVNFAAVGPNYMIRMDSRGAAPANFNASADYNLRILNYDTLAGYDTNTITIETNLFLGGAGGWALTNAANSLWLIYRIAPAAASPNLTWNVPNNGNWSENGNWLEGVAPAAGGNATNVVRFGDDGTIYYSTNDLAGIFLLNQLQFSSLTAATNILRGNPLAFTNDGARLDYLLGINGGFVVSNSLLLATNVTCGGNALRGEVTIIGAVTNLGRLVKNGTWTMVLSNANNNFVGPVVVDSTDGRLQLNHVSALDGTGSVTVSNGTLAINQWSSSYYFSNGRDNRTGLVAGNGALWSNRADVANNQSGYSLGATNVRFTVDGGRHDWVVRFHAFNTGSKNGLLVVTNGGQIFASTYGSWMAYNATNCAMRVTGDGSLYDAGVQEFIVSDIGSSNELVIADGGVVTNANGLRVGNNAGIANRLVVTNGGNLFMLGTLYVGNGGGSAGNEFRVTGTNSLWYTSGNAVYVGQAGTTNNALIVENGGIATNIRLITSGAMSNMVRIKDGGRMYGYANAQYVGYGALAAYSEVAVSGSDSLYNVNNQAFDVAAGATNLFNTLTVADGGLMTNITVLTIAAGIGAQSNGVLVTNGGSLFAGRIVCGCRSNSFNRLTVESGGNVTNAGSIYLATGYASSNNGVTVNNGGRLHTGLLVCTNNFTNDLTLNAGSITVITNMIITNAVVNFNGGVLNLRDSRLTNGAAQVVGNGSDSATLNLLGGTNFFGDGLVITNAATLSGNGYILAATTIHGANDPAGAITNNGPFTLTNACSSRFDISGEGAAGINWDYEAVSNGTLTLGGDLKVVLGGGFTPTNTYSFVIMTNSDVGGYSIAGAFANAPNNTRVPVYSNNLAAILGTFRVGISNNYVVLDSFLANVKTTGAIFLFY